MLLMQVTILLFVAVVGGLVVFTRDPASQAVAISFYGLLLAVMFMLYQAPDVALSQIVIGAVALPLMIMLALTKVRMANQDREQQKQRKGREHTPESDHHQPQRSPRSEERAA